MDPTKVRRYSHKAIELRAAAVLAEAFPSAISVPIDIDLLVQRHELVDDIVPMRYLELKFEVAAVLLSKTKGRFDILVDEDNYVKQPLRANFSIAHEFGHIVLHPGIWRKCRTVDDVIKIHMAVKYDYRFLERMANRFASAVLMPGARLRQHASDLYHDLATANKYDEDLVYHKLWSFLANKYRVKTEPMRIRLKEFNLQDQIASALQAKSPYLLPAD